MSLHWCFLGPLFPYSSSCMPDMIPHFVGRLEESQAILDHLTNGVTRLVNVWGPPGFGKTSVAINVAPQRRNIVRIFHPIFVVFLVKMAEDGKVSKVLKYILFTFNLLYWVSCEILLQMCCIRRQRDFHKCRSIKAYIIPFLPVFIRFT